MSQRSSKGRLRGITVSALLTLAMTGANYVQAQDDSAPVVNPLAGRDDLVPAGKTLFNVHCSHCHGPNAFQGERVRDLRRLSRRYRDDIQKVFITTALNGRPEKGMPPWQGKIEEEELWKIFNFLKTVQKK